jgi:hypothetical protein
MNGYSLLLGVGASLGLLQVLRRVPESQSLRWTGAGLGILAAALAGARAAYVWLFPAYYQAHPEAAWQISQGGLAWPGALLGGMIVFVFAALLLHAPLGYAADVYAPLFTTMAIVSWLGAAFTGSAYGAEVNEVLPWALPSSQPDGVLTYRWPLQLTAALTLFYFAWRLDGRSEKWRLPDVRAAVNGLLLAGHTTLFSYWRADGGLIYNGLRVDFAATAALAGLCLLHLLTRLVQRIRLSIITHKAERAYRQPWYFPRE